MRILRSFLGRRAERAEHPAAIPSGYRVYAVGDVHGELELLEQMLERIEADIAARPERRNVLVFLGDLIDRGPDSAGVVERLRTYRHPRVRTVFIAGNHEEVLLRILAGEDELVPSWLRFGGLECMASYGLPADLPGMPDEQAGAAIRAAVPAEHRAFIERFVDSFRAGSYLFVHAGIRPGVPLDQQAPEDLRWIRKPFLDCPDGHGAMIVHGHTISAEVEETPGRIGIDTGAYRFGTLTALALEGAERWFLDVRRAAGGGIAGDPVLASAPGTGGCPAVGA